MFCRGSVVILADLGCAAIAAGVVAVTPVAVAGFAMVLSNDPGGPMFLPIVALGAFLAAAAVSGTLFALTLVVEGFRRLFKARWWAASLVAVPAVTAFAAAVAWLAGATPQVTFGVAVSALVIFAAYWHAYLIAQVLLTRIVDRLLPNRICATPRSI